MRSDSLEFLRSLSHTPSPSGSEFRVARIFTEYVTKFADDVSTDVNGNVISVINPSGTMKVMMAAHMDEIGFIVHYIGNNGFLHFQSTGGNDPGVAVGQRVWVHGAGGPVAGVIGYKPMQLLQSLEINSKPTVDQ